MSAVTTGVILAAGAGTRFNGGGIQPKCLARFGGTPLIELQLRAMRACGLDHITVVVGFGAGDVRAACGPGVRFIENTRFAETNSLYSLWLARAVLQQGFVVMNCDVLFPATILNDLVTARHDNALLVSYPEPGDSEFDDEEMKVQVRRGRVVAIGKDLPPGDTDAENVGIVKFGAPGAQRLIPLMDQIVEGGSERDWAPRAFGVFAQQHPLFAIGTRGLPWTEIDTPDDYKRAVGEVFPAIRRVAAGLSRTLVEA
jgi:L-glutamine-phosphate cytidylyltransferase